MKYITAYLFSFIVFITTVKAQDSTAIQVSSGWNLLSLPLAPLNTNKNILFPSASSNLYKYQNKYIAVDTVQHGKGYWVKFDSLTTISLTGATILGDNVEANTGWNLIGSLSSPFLNNTIQTLPSGIISSSYLSYTPGMGYQSTDTVQPGKGYWIKVNRDGEIISSSVSSCAGIPIVTYAGKTYHTVQIGEQCWLKENLNVGTMIDGSLSQSNNSVIEKYCYNNDSENCNTFGGLYTWYEATHYVSSEKAQGICPSGWHLPTQTEFDTLKKYVNFDGNLLKANGQGSEIGSGINTSGFSALLSGYHQSNGSFNKQGKNCSLLSSTGYSSSGYPCASLTLNDYNNFIRNYGSFFSLQSYIVGSDGILLRMGHVDTDWDYINTQVTSGFLSVVNYDQDTMFALGKHSVYRSNNGGTSWFDLHLDTLTSRNLKSIASLNAYGATNKPSLIIICGDSGTIIRSTNRGRTWKQIVLTNINANLNYAYIRYDQANVYVCGDSIVLRAPNWGATWSVQNLPKREKYNAIKFITKTNGRVVGSNGTILYTNNSGNTWTPEPTNITANLNGLAYIFGSTSNGIAREYAWAVGENGTILTASDTGLTSWKQLSSGTTVNLHDVFFADTLMGYAFGDSGVILYTENGGLSWNRIASGTTSDLYSASFLPPLYYLNGASVRCLKDY